MTVCWPPIRKKFEFSTFAEDLGFSLAISSNCWGQLVEQKLGRRIIWGCITISSLLSHHYFFLTKNNRQCILGARKKWRTRTLTPTISLFPSGKRSPYSPLIVWSTNLHSATSNDLRVFWRTRSSISFCFFSLTIFSFLAFFMGLFIVVELSTCT